MKRLKKVGLFCALAAAGFATAQAEESAYLKLNFNSESASPEFYLIASKPTITFNDDNLVVTLGEESVSYGKSTIESFEFAPVTAGVDDLTVSGAAWSFDGNTLQIGNTTATALTVFDAQGRQVAAAQANGGAITADLSSLAHGVYVVNLQGSKSFKIIK